MKAQSFQIFRIFFYYRFLPNWTYLKIFWARCLQSKMTPYAIVSLINHCQTGCHRNIRSRKILSIPVCTPTHNHTQYYSHKNIDLIVIIISHPLESMHKCTALHESTDVCTIMNACMHINKLVCLEFRQFHFHTPNCQKKKKINSLLCSIGFAGVCEIEIERDVGGCKVRVLGRE